MQKGGPLFTFTLPAKAVSWNTLARKNHWYYTKAFDYWKDLTLGMANALKPKAPYNGPVRLIFEARWKGKRAHDADNILVKPIVDQLKDMGFFIDDNTFFIPEVVLRGSNCCNKDELVVTCERYV